MLNRSASGQESPVQGRKFVFPLNTLLAVGILQMPFIELRVLFSIPGC